MSECIFDKGKYFVNGEEFYRVTSILGVVAKPMLLFWYGKVGNEAAKKILEESSLLGSSVHNLLERLGKGEDIKYYPCDLHKRAVSDMKKWLKKNKVEFVETEHRIHHTEYHFAGTCDAIVKIDGELVLLDYKTSGACYNTYALQLAAYKEAYEHMNPGKKISRAILLRFEKDLEKKESFEVFEVKDLDRCWEVFKHTLELYKWEKERGGKFNKIK
jgi:hypothetical protein